MISKHDIVGLTVCVGYGDILAVTIRQNAEHLRRILVVSSPQDEETARVVAQVPNVDLYVTDAFYRGGARFNKGAAIEEGFDEIGRSGWILLHDADILFPDSTMPLADIEVGNLYSCWRRLQPDINNWSAVQWHKLHRRRDAVFAGFFHLFHAGDPALAGPPWYETNWVHAGGADLKFSWRWPAERRRRLHFDVLHIGEVDQNWCGRVTKRMDGTVPEGSDDRRQVMQQMMESQRRRGRFHQRSHDHERI